MLFYQNHALKHRGLLTNSK